MRAARHDRRFLALSIAVGAVPFVFAVIRAIETAGRDLRYVWVALAGLCGTAAAASVARRSAGLSTLAVSAAVFVTASVFAMAAAWWLGTVVGPAMVIVAAGFAVCFTLGALAYPRAQTLNRP